MKQKTRMIKNSFTITPDLLRRVHAFCHKVDRPVASVIRLALIEYLERHTGDIAPSLPKGD